MSETTEAIDIPAAAPKTVPIPKPEDGKAKKTKSPAKKKKAVMMDPELFSADNIALQIVGAHEIAAVMLGPEARIEEKPARSMAEAIARIIELYDMEWLARIWPWVALALTIAMAETPVVLRTVRARRQKTEGTPSSPAGPLTLIDTTELEAEVNALRQQAHGRRGPRTRGPAGAP